MSPGTFKPPIFWSPAAMQIEQNQGPFGVFCRIWKNSYTISAACHWYQANGPMTESTENEVQTINTGTYPQRRNKTVSMKRSGATVTAHYNAPLSACMAPPWLLDKTQMITTSLKQSSRQYPIQQPLHYSKNNKMIMNQLFSIIVTLCCLICIAQLLEMHNSLAYL